ncbi:NAD-dependent epimerase/dehydratase family protein [Legionella bononiensis]|uniref:NAD(P)-dependent oxidoreductase n=1 Tax=Legionella bononiensis TaxID=2793102 RepID=A0ABS1WCB4_9GAMM|nr:NAD(P)-dependent oxidoreductase [Legionella bononiensis]MBL7478864.1 NAD(P)-dependent oxidoreductase [Legionella bononiensis]MBL7526994.1 NAD(P)-dependent oxidoreductase [Legionella bononiensis]MBL7562412.1 NAD(P)-dependent oxidoreductase [Legionella bononiensis]
MRCVVTGSTGCLGMNLTRHLLALGHDVIALGRNKVLGKLLNHMGAEFIALDLKERDALKTITRNTDVIFHCAALSSPWGSYKDFYEANVLATQHVIEATPSEARLVYVSSPSIYFDFNHRHDIKEHARLPETPANHYVRTKLIAESVIDEAYKTKHLKVITLRPRAIFGPYDRSIIPRILKSEKNGVLPIIGSGENLIDITYVDNVVDALILASHADPQFFGNKYNITNGEPKTLIAILELLFNALQKPLNTRMISYSKARVFSQCLELVYGIPFIKKEPPLTRYSAGVLHFGQTLNIDAAIRDLNYSPKISIEQGIALYTKWCNPL